MGVHVVPAVGQEPCTAAHALHGEKYRFLVARHEPGMPHGYMSVRFVDYEGIADHAKLAEKVTGHLCRLKRRRQALSTAATAGQFDVTTGGLADYDCRHPDPFGIIWGLVGLTAGGHVRGQTRPLFTLG